MAIRSLTIDGNVVNEIELRDRLTDLLVEKFHMKRHETQRMATVIVDEIFIQWGDDGD